MQRMNSISGEFDELKKEVDREKEREFHISQSLLSLFCCICFYIKIKNEMEKVREVKKAGEKPKLREL